MARQKVSKPVVSNSHQENHHKPPHREDPSSTSTNGAPVHPHNHSENGSPGALAAADSTPPLSKAVPAELAEKVKELVRLSQEQGYLTYTDINETLPDNLASPENIEEILLQLRNLEVEIVDPAEVDRVKQPEPEEEDEKTRLDILDDPVRMYLKQMGQVPLLTREQEVEISKRIEEAEDDIKN